jgi:hypothetical protein
MGHHKNMTPPLETEISPSLENLTSPPLHFRRQSVEEYSGKEAAGARLDVILEACVERLPRHV